MDMPSPVFNLSRAQRRKLRQLLRDAWLGVPMYRALYEPLGVTERDLSDPQILSRLPIITKSRLLETPPAERVDARFDISGLTKETTTGSTGQPFAMYIDDRYRRLRNLRFLRGLTSAGYRPWHRLLMLTDRHGGLTRKLNRYYQSVECPAEDILAAYRKVRPHVLYGFATPLRQLAESLRRSPRDTHRPRIVVSTAEMLDVAARDRLAEAFDAPVYDFYGMTEMGLVAWQGPGFSGYFMAHNAVVTEFMATDSCQGRYRMLMTNLDLRASPIIRFDSGDLAYVETVDGEARVAAFEGRLIDTILRQDGTEVSPYRITDALRDVAGVKRFKITQRQLHSLAVDLEVESSARTQATARISSIFTELLGAGVRLEFGFRDDLVPEGSRKFRPVESLVARS